MPVQVALFFKDFFEVSPSDSDKLSSSLKSLLFSANFLTDEFYITYLKN